VSQPDPAQLDELATILRNTVAVGACKFALANFHVFAGQVQAHMTAAGQETPLFTDPDSLRALLELFVDEQSADNVGSALVLAALMQKPEQP